MTQEERWMARYGEAMRFLEENHRTPSKHRIEEHDYLNWGKSHEKEIECRVGLIHQTIHKMKPRMISYAGISCLEDIMRKCQNVFGYGVSTSYPPALRTQIIEILDKQIYCRSSKADLMREFCG